MRRFVAGQNLERYRRLLAVEPDEHRRSMLEQLLAEEEEAWKELPDAKAEKPKPS